jgi:hypothetical protein
VLPERRGTCSTKHALLAALALEHDAPVELRLGIYPMDGRNTPGIENVLVRHGLDHIPEAHCYLAYRGRRIDLTGPDADTKKTFLHEETIDPDRIGAYKVQAHQTFLRTWATNNGIDPDEAWLAREECIATLTAS